MFQLTVLIDLWLIKQNNMIKTIFLDIAFNAFLAQGY